MNIKNICLMLLFCLTSQLAFGAGLYITTNPSSAKIERYDESARTWVNLGEAPRLFVTERYEYVLLRISLAGYTAQEKGYTTDLDGTTYVNEILIPEDSNPATKMLFAVGGTVSSRSGKLIIAGMYKVLTRNMTTYRPSGGLACQDTNPIQDDKGWYTNTLQDPNSNRAIAVGDRIFTGVFSYDMKRCHGYRYVTVTAEDVNAAYIIVDIVIP